MIEKKSEHNVSIRQILISIGYFDFKYLPRNFLFKFSIKYSL